MVQKTNTATEIGGSKDMGGVKMDAPFMDSNRFRLKCVATIPVNLLQVERQGMFHFDCGMESASDTSMFVVLCLAVHCRYIWSVLLSTAAG